MINFYFHRKSPFFALNETNKVFNFAGLGEGWREHLLKKPDKQEEPRIAGRKKKSGKNR